MDPLALVPQHIRDLILSGDSSVNCPLEDTFPFARREEFAVVAIIDISGYSKLSSYLQEILGTDSGAKVKELLNKPINVIIKHVHQSGGSIVKFAGDAVIATWKKKPATIENRETLTRSVFLGCLHLMNFFKNYELSVPEKSNPKCAQFPLTSGRESEYSTERRRSSLLAADSAEKNTKKIPLKIHIGLGVGEMQHIHIGHSVANGSAECLLRSEYFVAGKALRCSGLLLGLGKPGDLTFDSAANDLVSTAFINEPSFPPVRKSSRELGGRYFMVTETDPVDKYIECLVQDLGAKAKSLASFESKLITKRPENYVEHIAPYVDDSLAQRIQSTAPTEESNTSEGDNYSIVDLGNYDQLRGVAVLFVYFPSFNVETISEPENLSLLQKITVIIIKAVREHQGCLRQFNCDDKSLTALLVWGLEGFAHEKSECYFSMAAAMDAAIELKKLLGDKFAIGVTKGTVFAGIIGNHHRCDGTLLGVCVNNAARLMCLDNCKGGILCDIDTYRDTCDSIDYDVNIPEVVLKGVAEPVKVYAPIQRNKNDGRSSRRLSVFAGRDEELQQISRIIETWIAESKKRLIVFGRSGTGKSVVANLIAQQMKTHQNVVLCVAKSYENQQTTNLAIFTQIITELITAVAHSGATLRDLRVRCHREIEDGYFAHNVMSRGTSFSVKVENIIKTSATDLAKLPVLDSKLLSAFRDNSNKRSNKSLPSAEMLLSTQVFRNVSISAGKKSTEPKSDFKRENAEATKGSEIDASITISKHPDFDTGSDVSVSDILLYLFSNPECDTLNAIPGLKLNPNIPIMNLSRLSHILSFLLSCFASLGLKAAILIDDLQVRNIYLIDIAQKNTHVTDSIELGNLNRHAIETMIMQLSKHKPSKINSTLSNEIFTRSQGNPLVAEVLIRILNDDENVRIVDNVLTRVGDSNSATLPSGATAAVVAQFDKLKPGMKTILKYASISGMTFRVSDLNEILLKSVESLPYDGTEVGLEEAIALYDVYQFVKATEVDGIYSFAHFLIQQGILSTMVPSQREEIHSVYVDSFLKRIKKAVDKWETIQSIVNHLSHMTGQEERKQIALYTLFLECAEMGKVDEALEIYDNLNRFKDKIKLTKNVFEEIREQRVLADIHFIKRNEPETRAFCESALSLSGYKPAQNLVSSAFRLLKIMSVVKKLMTAQEDGLFAVEQSKQFAKTTFPKAFIKVQSLNTVRGSTSSHRHQMTQAKAYEELLQVLQTFQKILPSSLQLVELRGISLILGCGLFGGQAIQMASYYSEFSHALDSIGFRKLRDVSQNKCQQLAAVANVVIEDYIKTTKSILCNNGSGFSKMCYFTRNAMVLLHLL
ncbi:hypothetical protein HDU83_001101 [Entophlyctis luteolus]|nr:hypothetical protein HDU83_001101 [Entophlyctis luteolus]